MILFIPTYRFILKPSLQPVCVHNTIMALRCECLTVGLLVTERTKFGTSLCYKIRSRSFYKELKLQI